MMDKVLYQQHPICCIIAGRSCCSKTYVLTNLVLNIVNEAEKLYTHTHRV